MSKVRNNDEKFVLCWKNHDGNVVEVAKELDIKENTARLRALKYINAGVKLPPPQKKVRTRVSLGEKVEHLNSLLT